MKKITFQHLTEYYYVVNEGLGVKENNNSIKFNTLTEFLKSDKFNNILMQDDYDHYFLVLLFQLAYCLKNFQNNEISHNFCNADNILIDESDYRKKTINKFYINNKEFNIENIGFIPLFTNFMFSTIGDDKFYNNNSKIKEKYKTYLANIFNINLDQINQIDKRLEYKITKNKETKNKDAIELFSHIYNIIYNKINDYNENKIIKLLYLIQNILNFEYNKIEYYNFEKIIKFIIKNPINFENFNEEYYTNYKTELIKGLPENEEIDENSIIIGIYKHSYLLNGIFIGRTNNIFAKKYSFNIDNEKQLFYTLEIVNLDEYVNFILSEMMSNKKRYYNVDAIVINTIDKRIKFQNNPVTRINYISIENNNVYSRKPYEQSPTRFRENESEKPRPQIKDNEYQEFKNYFNYAIKNLNENILKVFDIINMPLYKALYNPEYKKNNSGKNNKIMKINNYDMIVKIYIINEYLSNMIKDIKMYKNNVSNDEIEQLIKEAVYKFDSFFKNISSFKKNIISNLCNYDISNILKDELFNYFDNIYKLKNDGVSITEKNNEIIKDNKFKNEYFKFEYEFNKISKIFEEMKDTYRNIDIDDNNILILAKFKYDNLVKSMILSKKK